MTAVALAIVAVCLVAGLVVAFRPRRTTFRSDPLKRAGIDPFTLADPWRRHVQNAVNARSTLTRAVDQRLDGPTKDRLFDLLRSVDDIVDQIWVVAQEGNQLNRASRITDLRSLETRLSEAERDAGAAPPDRREAAEASLASVRQSVEVSRGLVSTRDRADVQLTALADRLNELVVRAIEISTVQVGSDRSEAIRVDLDSMVLDLEGLRLGLEETRGLASEG